MQNVPAPPDVDSVTNRGGDRTGHRKLARVGWVGIAAAVAVLVAAGAYGIKNSNAGTTDRQTNHPSKTSPQTYLDNGAAKAPGTYRMLVGADDVGAPIDADLTFYDVWEGG